MKKIKGNCTSFGLWKYKLYNKKIIEDFKIYVYLKKKKEISFKGNFFFKKLNFSILKVKIQNSYYKNFRTILKIGVGQIFESIRLDWVTQHSTSTTQFSSPSQESRRQHTHTLIKKREKKESTTSFCSCPVEPLTKYAPPQGPWPDLLHRLRICYFTPSHH